VPKKKKLKPKIVQAKSLLTKKVKEEFERFIEYHPSARFSSNLRRMLLEFLMYDGAIEANYLHDLIYDLDGLFELLEVIQSDSKSHDN
jgi:hypothetical protein